MKVAITGISSYLAKCLVPKLEKDDDIEGIIGIDIAPLIETYKKVKFYQADIGKLRLGLLFGEVENI